MNRYSSEDVSGNESSEAVKMTETERQADFKRHKEEMQKKRKKKKRTSSSLHSSTFQGKHFYILIAYGMIMSTLPSVFCSYCLFVLMIRALSSVRHHNVCLLYANIFF